MNTITHHQINIIDKEKKLKINAYASDFNRCPNVFLTMIDFEFYFLNKIILKINI